MGPQGQRILVLTGTLGAKDSNFLLYRRENEPREHEQFPQITELFSGGARTRV